MSDPHLGFQAAVELRHTVVDDGHVLLDLLAGRPDPVAAQALTGLGVDRDAVVSATQRRAQAGSAAVEPSEAHFETQASVPWYAIGGRAAAFAASLGDGELRSTDWLLALLWTDQPFPLLEEQGVSREAVLDALRERGTELPRAAPPEVIRTNMTQRIEFDIEIANIAIRILRERHPAGQSPHWGFNHAGAGRAYLIAEDGIDLDGIVAEAAASQ